MKRAKAENAIIYWADETGVSNCEIVERGFSPKGRPPVLPVETKRQRVNMISAISSQGSVRFMVYQDTMNQQLTRDSCPIPRKIFPTKSSHLCADYSIIPPLFPVSSSTRRFPIFTRRSNIDIAVMRLQLFTTGAMIEAPVFINLAPDFPFIWLTIAGL